MNLEDNIREKLESRRIAPTASAWDRIEGKLEADQGKKKSKAVLWIGIAASFIAGVFLTALLFSEGVNDRSNEFVESPDSKEILNDTEMEESKKTIKNPEEQLAQEVESREMITEESTLSRKHKTERTNKPTLANSASKPSQKSLRNNTTMGQLVQLSGREIVNTPALDVTSENDKQSNRQKITSTISLEQITDAEVDVLLEEAQRDIVSDKIFDTRHTRVDANALLLDIEAEVDPETFKEKIFQKVKKEIGRAVEAVVNKDN